MNLFTTTSLILASITGATHLGHSAADSLLNSLEPAVAELESSIATPQRKTYTIWVSGRVGADKFHHKDLPFTIKDIYFKSTSFPQGWGYCTFRGQGTNTLSIRPNTVGIVGAQYSATVTVEVVY